MITAAIVYERSTNQFTILLFQIFCKIRLSIECWELCFTFLSFIKYFNDCYYFTMFFTHSFLFKKNKISSKTEKSAFKNAPILLHSIRILELTNILVIYWLFESNILPKFRFVIFFFSKLFLIFIMFRYLQFSLPSERECCKTILETTIITLQWHSLSFYWTLITMRTCLVCNEINYCSYSWMTKNGN